MKQLPLLFITLLCFTSAFAQKKSLRDRFIFGVGGGVYSIKASGNSSTLPALELSPMLVAWNRWSDFSISANSRPSFGYHIKNDALPNSFFFTDLPLTAELNLGHGSTKNFYSNFGFFAGAGYGWQFLGDTSQSGGVYTGGFRTWLGPLSATFRYSYIQSNSFQAHNMHRATISITFGRWVKKVRQMNKISSFVKPVKK